MNANIDPEEVMWSERKRNWCGTPFTFTTYTLTDDSLIVKTGFLRQKYDTIKLFRITDLTVTRSLLQRIFGLGTIIVEGFDQSTGGHLEIKNIRNVFDAKRLIDHTVDGARSVNRVTSREYMGTDFDEEGNNNW